MFGKTQKTALKIKNFNPFRKKINIQASEVIEARKYIRDYWKTLKRKNPKDHDNYIGLPNTFLVPSTEDDNEFDYDEMYYWDCYFMVQGLLDESHKDLVLGIIENLVYMFNKFKIIPNASRTYLTSRSQPPLLTSLIWDAFDTYNLDINWLGKMLAVAEQEYAVVWMGKRKPNARQVYRGLSRYYDFNYLNDIAETESGWDMTSRFNRKCLDYLAVDLNSLLYKYEKDFARYYHLIGNKALAAHWDLAAKHRASNMNDLMWSKSKGLYYDYNFEKNKQGSVRSLAGYYPMWTGMIDKHQALSLVRSLKHFEHSGGLATTDVQQLSQLVPGSKPLQWSYPNGWAPLHYLVIKGLERYGYHEDARRIALKWIRTNLNWYNKHGIFLEKYNVVQPDKPPYNGVYPPQTGFGWTNAIFERLCQDYIDK